MPDGYLYPRGSNPENGIEFKTITNESPSLSSSVSDSPVEEGQQISDHVEDEPVSGSITVVFATLDSYNILKRYHDSKTILIYVSELDVLENLVITDLSPNRSRQYGSGYECTIDLKQIRIATAQTQEVRLPDPPTDNDTEEEIKDKGEKQPERESVDEESTVNEDDSETTAEQKQSLLSKGASAISSWFGG